MKKLIALFLALMMVVSLCACSNETVVEEVEPEAEVGLTEEDLEYIVAMSLYNELENEREDPSGPRFNDVIHIGLTAYKITLIEDYNQGAFENAYRVCGVFYLYNDYGQPTQRYWSAYGGQGGTSATFEVIITETGVPWNFTIN